MTEQVAALGLLSALLFCGFMAMVGMNFWLWHTLVSWRRDVIRQRLREWVSDAQGR